MMSNNTMSREVQQSVDVSDTSYDDVDGDLLLNNLIYELPKALSLVTNRTHKRQFSQRSTYTVDRNTTMVWEMSTGNAFGNIETSYLHYKMTAKNVTPAIAQMPSFASGSALNLHREVRIQSRGGTEIDRLENCNLYNKNRIDYEKSDQWKKTIGATFFVDSAVALFDTANTLVTEVNIPLTQVACFFTLLKKGQLVPPQVLSGLRLEISLESLARAFKDPLGYFGAGSSLELSDIYISMDCVDMSDETSKLISLESSQTGLEICYNRVYNNSHTYAAGTNSFTSQISKSVSQATHAFTVISNNTNANLSTVDSFDSEGFKITSWQYRLGSQYYPHQAIISQVGATVTVKGQESYLHAMASYEKMAKSFCESSVTPSQFSTSKGMLAVSLERNMSLAISGCPINNARILELICERDGSNDGVDKIDVNTFLSYVSVAKSYIDNVAISI
jgi:hypothetical protein